MALSTVNQPYVYQQGWGPLVYAVTPGSPDACNYRAVFDVWVVKQGGTGTFVPSYQAATECVFAGRKKVPLNPSNICICDVSDLVQPYLDAADSVSHEAESAMNPIQNDPIYTYCSDGTPIAYGPTTPIKLLENESISVVVYVGEEYLARENTPGDWLPAPCGYPGASIRTFDGIQSGGMYISPIPPLGAPGSTNQENIRFFIPGRDTIVGLTANGRSYENVHVIPAVVGPAGAWLQNQIGATYSFGQDTMYSTLGAYALPGFGATSNVSPASKTATTSALPTATLGKFLSRDTDTRYVTPNDHSTLTFLNYNPGIQRREADFWYPGMFVFRYYSYTTIVTPTTGSLFKATMSRLTYEPGSGNTAGAINVFDVTDNVGINPIGAFNASTGIFTAPVGGTYSFLVGCAVTGGTGPISGNPFQSVSPTGGTCITGFYNITTGTPFNSLSSVVPANATGCSNLTRINQSFGLGGQTFSTGLSAGQQVAWYQQPGGPGLVVNCGATAWSQSSLLYWECYGFPSGITYAPIVTPGVGITQPFYNVIVNAPKNLNITFNGMKFYGGGGANAILPLISAGGVTGSLLPGGSYNRDRYFMGSLLCGPADIKRMCGIGNFDYVDYYTVQAYSFNLLGGTGATALVDNSIYSSNCIGHGGSQVNYPVSEMVTFNVMRDGRFNTIAPGPYDPIRMSWLNDLGGRDYYTFAKYFDITTQREDQTYYKDANNYSGSTWTTSPWKSGNTVLNTDITRQIKVMSEFMTEDGVDFMWSLFTSPSVHAWLPYDAVYPALSVYPYNQTVTNNNGPFPFPCRIISNNYQQVKQAALANKLVPLEFVLEIAIPERRQQC